MAGPSRSLKEELEPAVKGAGETTVGWPWSSLVTRNAPVAGQDTLFYQRGYRVRIGQGMGCVGAPAPASHWERRTWDGDVS